MALRNQPYFPLYIQDYLTDEKLNMCSWATQGIYIKILCILHKQEVYGRILFKQISKQNESTIKKFASILVRHIPCQIDDMMGALIELMEYDVLKIDKQGLYQKRMVRDGEISEARSNAAKKGGGNPILFKQNSKQTDKQNPEYENEYEYEDKDDNELIEKGGMGEKEDPDVITPEVDEDVYLFDNFWDDYDKKVGSKEKLRKKWDKLSDTNKLKIKDHIPLYKKSQPDKKYRKNPETYINNKSWNDEIITSNGNRNTANKRAGITEDYKNSILKRLQGASDTEDVPEHNYTHPGF